MYEEPAWAIGRLVVIIARDDGATTSVAVTDAVNAGLLESDTVKVTEVLPLEAGSPDIAPLLPRLSPAGRAPEDQV